MRKLRLALLTTFLTLGGCYTQFDPVGPPPAPPTPKPPVPPTPPTPPPPPPPEAPVVVYAQVGKVDAATSLAELFAITGGGPYFTADLRDGTQVLRWRALNSSGRERILEVHVTAAGKVLGHVLIQDRPDPPPPPAEASLGSCSGPNCRLPGR